MGTVREGDAPQTSTWQAGLDLGRCLRVISAASTSSICAAAGRPASWVPGR
jgi:hypothetical protein